MASTPCFESSHLGIGGIAPVICTSFTFLITFMVDDGGDYDMMINMVC